MLLAGIDTSFDLDFNDYLHSRFLMRGTSSLRNSLGTLNRRSLYFRGGNFLTSSVTIVSSLSANSLRAHNLTLLRAGTVIVAHSCSRLITVGADFWCHRIEGDLDATECHSFSR
jgi:hypothetical protein